MATWEVHARIRHIQFSREHRTSGGKLMESTDVALVEASSPLQARVRGQAELQRRYPGQTIRITSAHQVTEDEESEQE